MIILKVFIALMLFSILLYVVAYTWLYNKEPKHPGWKEVNCSECNGTGRKPSWTCPICRGTGKHSGGGPCNMCAGTGTLPEGICPICGGSGKMIEEL